MTGLTLTHFDEALWVRDESPMGILRTTHLYYLHVNGQLIAKPAHTYIPVEDFIPTGLVVSVLRAGASLEAFVNWLDTLHEDGFTTLPSSYFVKNYMPAMEWSEA